MWRVEKLLLKFFAKMDLERCIKNIAVRKNLDNLEKIFITNLTNKIMKEQFAPFRLEALFAYKL